MSGETVYGWCERFHRRYGTTTKETGEVLFGRPYASRQKSFPSELTRFVRVTQGRLGDEFQILMRHTPIGCYWPFLSSEQKDRVRKISAQGNGDCMFLASGFTASQLHSAHPLRCCIQCMDEQLKDSGETTWMLMHQHPGVWVCPVHGKLLIEFQSHEQIWTQPSPLPEDPTAGLRVRSQRELDALRTCAGISMALSRRDEVSEAGLRIATIDRMRSLGLMASPARINIEKTKKWFAQTHLGQCLGRSERMKSVQAGTWMRSTVRGARRAHPLKWILLWSALFEDESSDHIVRAFQDACTGLLTNGDSSQFRLPFEIAFMQGGAHSAPSHVVDAFDRSNTLEQAASLLGVSQYAAKAWLEQDPLLAHDWTDRIRLERLDHACDRLHLALDMNPTMSRAKMLATFRAEVEYLRAHTPKRLRSILDRIPARRHAQGQLFQWSEESLDQR